MREGLNPEGRKGQIPEEEECFGPKATPWGTGSPLPASLKEIQWQGKALASCCLTTGGFLLCSRSCKSEGSVPHPCPTDARAAL